MRLVFFGNSARWAFLFRRQDEKTDKTERQARDSWIDEVHMPASWLLYWLCSLFLSHLLSLGSSDRSHNEKHPTPFFFVFPACTEKKEEGLPCALLSGSAVALGAFSLVIVLGSNGDEG